MLQEGLTLDSFMLLTPLFPFRSQELLRQPSILKDPSFSSNPFQALRQHARNTLTFDGPVEKHNSGGKKKVKKGDEMEM